MRYLTGGEVAAHLEGVLHRETQQHDYETDLTAGAIFRVAGTGTLDFGGSEYAQAPREPLQPQKADPGDEHGWWALDQGTYIVRYNESVHPTPTQIAFIQPHERLLLAGGYHAAFHFRAPREELETLLIVGPGGLRVKENARISKLLIFALA